MSLTIYHNPRCSKSRQTLERIRASGHKVTIIDYQKTPPTAATIEQLASRLSLPTAGILRSGDDAVKTASDLPSLDDDAALAIWMAAHPGSLQRPIVVDDKTGRAILGRPPENVELLLK